MTLFFNEFHFFRSAKFVPLTELYVVLTKWYCGNFVTVFEIFSFLIWLKNFLPTDFSVRSFNIFVSNNRLMILKVFIDRKQICWRISFFFFLDSVQLNDRLNWTIWKHFSKKCIRSHTYFLIVNHFFNDFDLFFFWSPVFFLLWLHLILTLQRCNIDHAHFSKWVFHFIKIRFWFNAIFFDRLINFYRLEWIFQNTYSWFAKLRNSFLSRFEKFVDEYFFIFILIEQIHVDNFLIQRLSFNNSLFYLLFRWELLQWSILIENLFDYLIIWPLIFDDELFEYIFNRQIHLNERYVWPRRCFHNIVY